MSLNDKPSVLTVCVPGSTADPGALDLKEILAARKQAAARCDRPACSGSIPDCNRSGPECDECDDSACGVNAVSEFSGTGAEGRGLVEPVRGQESEIDATGTGPTVGAAGASFFHADSGKKAMELLRMLRFDLLVTGDRLPDMPMEHFIRRVRMAWPWQKWAMVGSAITPPDEIAARTLGAMAVFDAPPDWDVLSSLAAIAADKAAGLKLGRSQMREVGALRGVSGSDEVMPLPGGQGAAVAQASSEGTPGSAAPGSVTHASALESRRQRTKRGIARRDDILSRRISNRSVG
jgi:hypothetical protein